MDFMNLLKSAELLLFEVVSWLVFYPLTLWRCIRHPILMMAQAQEELEKSSEEQFPDVLSPPIFLFLTLMLVHLAQTSLFRDQGVLSGALADARNLLIFRAVAFSLFPLLLALQHIRLMKTPLTRQSLRPLFYGQCYVTVPFMISLEVGLMMMAHNEGSLFKLAGTAVILVGYSWYVSALIRGFMFHRGVTRRHARRQAIAAVFVGTLTFLILTIVAFLITSGSIA